MVGANSSLSVLAILFNVFGIGLAQMKVLLLTVVVAIARSTFSYFITTVSMRHVVSVVLALIIRMLVHSTYTIVGSSILLF